MTTRYLIPAALGLFTLTAGALGGPVLTNGGFETGDLTGWSVATPARWTVMGVDDNNGTATGAPVNPIDSKMVRNAAIDNVQADSIWQIAAVSGATAGQITLKFNAARYFGSSGGGWSSSGVGGVTVYGLNDGYTLDATGVPLTNATALIAQTPSLAFQNSLTTGGAVMVIEASAASAFPAYLVRFQTQTGRNVYLDNVSLDVPGATPTAVPEPSVLGLIGSAGLLLVRRRR